MSGTTYLVEDLRADEDVEVRFMSVRFLSDLNILERHRKFTTVSSPTDQVTSDSDRADGSND